jgi:hypothetical protein
VFPLPHPTVVGRYRLPLTAIAAAEWNIIVTAATAKVAAGTDPTGLYAAVVACPTPVASVDSTWSPTGMFTPANPSAPTDGFPGVTPQR